uniref:Uncharacterized protein n=1 Tax=Oryza punctata TaxID=4537 RepID=A0A0E0LYV5_ORYPU
MVFRRRGRLPARWGVHRAQHLQARHDHSTGGQRGWGQAELEEFKGSCFEASSSVRDFVSSSVCIILYSCEMRPMVVLT